MRPLAGGTVAALREVGLDELDVARVLDAAFQEDLGGRGDLTSTALVPADLRAEGSFVAREGGVVAGLPLVLAAVATRIGERTELDQLVADGERVSAGAVLLRVKAPVAQLLGVERVSLNLLGQLSGVATLTRTWVQAVAGTGTVIRDTRKTAPGLRTLQKYAVRCGGGVNHRRGLDDGVLVKDNHIAAAGGIDAALAALDRARPGLPAGVPVQVEVDTLQQLDRVLDHLCDGPPEGGVVSQVLLDNFDDDRTREAVRRVRLRRPDLFIEASGGLTLERARLLAQIGVDSLAVGPLTHSARSLDVALDL